MPDIVKELRAFKTDLDEYAEILNRVWQRAPGHGWLGAATPQEHQRIELLRADLMERYGGLHDAIIEAHSAEPIIEAGGIVGGDAFLLAFADPADNPWLSAALDLAPPLVLQAIGFHRMQVPTTRAKIARRVIVTTRLAVGLRTSADLLGSGGLMRFGGHQSQCLGHVCPEGKGISQDGVVDIEGATDLTAVPWDVAEDFLRGQTHSARAERPLDLIRGHDVHEQPERTGIEMGPRRMDVQYAPVRTSFGLGADGPRRTWWSEVGDPAVRSFRDRGPAGAVSSRFHRLGPVSATAVNESKRGHASPCRSIVGGGTDERPPVRPTSLIRKMEARQPLDFDAVWNMADELRDVLPIFSLTEEERRELVAHMHVRRFRAGEVVYHRSDPAGDIFVVHQGLAKSLLHDEEGRELLIALHGRGDFFGALSLFEDGPRESTVQALIPTTVLQITRADAVRVLERNPRAMHFMFERFAAGIHQLAGMLEGIVFLDVPGRLARYLVELERLDGVALTQDDMAAAIGASRESVNKTLADFERRGLIKVERRQVQILKEPDLRREIRH